MVITILEGRLAAENWKALAEAYQTGTASLPPDMIQTFLVQDSADPAVWRIMTQWQSRAALEAYRQSVDTPGGVLMFRAAGAEPTLSVFDVRRHVLHHD
jgi:quinol monooxygenase YgiN